MTDSVLVPLIIGQSSEHFEKPTEAGHTHRWKVFVRSPPGFPLFSDRSYIKKVTFFLHNTFENPRRTIRNPPFEIEETGYGGFDFMIQIVFTNIPKQYSINYELTLPNFEKVTISSVENLLEVKNPPPEFVELALKYGGRRHEADKDKAKKAVSAPVDEPKKKEKSEKVRSKDKEKPSMDKGEKTKEHKKVKEKDRDKEKDKEKGDNKEIKKEHKHKEEKDKNKIKEKERERDKEKEKHREEKKRDKEREREKKMEVKEKVEVKVKEEIKEEKEVIKEVVEVKEKEKVKIKSEVKLLKPKKEPKSLLIVDDLFGPVPEKPKEPKDVTREVVKEKESKKHESPEEKPKKLKKPKHEDEPSEKKPKRSTPNKEVMVHVNEISKMPAILSPLPKMEDGGPSVLPVLTPHSSHIEENELTLQVEDLKRRLYVKIDPEEHKCPLLHFVGMSPEVISKYERPVPQFFYKDLYPEGDCYLSSYEHIEEKHGS